MHKPCWEFPSKLYVYVSFQSSMMWKWARSRLIWLVSDLQAGWSSVPNCMVHTLSKYQPFCTFLSFFWHAIAKSWGRLVITAWGDVLETSLMKNISLYWDFYISNIQHMLRSGYLLRLSILVYEPWSKVLHQDVIAFGKNILALQITFKVPISVPPYPSTSKYLFSNKCHPQKNPTQQRPCITRDLHAARSHPSRTILISHQHPTIYPASHSQSESQSKNQDFLPETQHLRSTTTRLTQSLRA